MALLLNDGFGLYNTNAGASVKGWTSAGGTIVFLAGRASTSRAVRLAGPGFTPGSLSRVLPTFSGATSIVGCAVRMPSPSGGGAGEFFNVSVGGVSVALRNTAVSSGVYSLTLCRDGSVVATLPGYAQSTWYYVEMKVDWAVAGNVTVRVDGSEYHNAAMTLAAPTAGLTIGLHSTFNGGVIELADLLVMDGSGSTFNDFQGDVIIETLFPTSDGATSGWTPSTGSAHWSLVDEAPLNNGDTDYVTTATVNAVDTYAMENLATSASSPVLAVRPVLIARKETAAVMSIAPTVRSAGTDYPGTARDLPNTLVYSAESDTLTTDPATAAAWTRSAVDALEVGPKKTA